MTIKKWKQKSSCFLLKITHKDQKPEPTANHLRCLALIFLTLRATILSDSSQAIVITNTKHQPVFKNKSNKHFTC